MKKELSQAKENDTLVLVESAKNGEEKTTLLIVEKTVTVISFKETEEMIILKNGKYQIMDARYSGSKLCFLDNEEVKRKEDSEKSSKSSKVAEVGKN